MSVRRDRPVLGDGGRDREALTADESRCLEVLADVVVVPAVVLLGQTPQAAR